MRRFCSYAGTACARPGGVAAPVVVQHGQDGAVADGHGDRARLGAVRGDGALGDAAAPRLVLLPSRSRKISTPSGNSPSGS